MRSKWLDAVASSEKLHDDSSMDTSGQPSTSTSGRHHGPRWFSVMQGLRRSLDVHLKSYYKIDSAFASTVRLTSASDKLKALTRAVTDTGLVEFCCIYLVHPARGTFGLIALSGAGAELYPPRLADEEAQRAIRMSDSGSQSFLNVFTRCVFQVNESNWCVEDVVASKAPWYYDCASAANGFGLPQDGGWLRRAGMRSMLALPCMQGNDVTGVLAVASKQKSLDHLLLRKLEELCYKITPTVTDAVVEYASLLCNRRVALRYESIPDFAHEVLGELLNLDRAVAASVSTLNRSAACVSQQQHAACAGAGGRARKAGGEERPARDATAAVAAAAAAGFTWTAPPALSAPMPAAVAAPVAAAGAAAQLERPSEQILLGVDTFLSALTEGALYSVVLTSDLASAALPVVEVPSTVIVALPEQPAPSEPLPLRPLHFDAAVAAPAATPQDVQLTHGSQAHGWSRAPHAATSRSLPERPPPDAADGAAMDYLRGCVTTLPSSSRQPHQQAPHPHHGQRPGAPARASSADHNASRSTRSLSCVEFSGGIAEAREELCSNNTSAAAEAPAAAAAAATVAAAPKYIIGDAPRALRAPRLPLPVQPHGRHGPSGSPGSSKRSSVSGAVEGYMFETRSTEDLAAALCNGGSTMMSPSAWSSYKNMESRVMQRGAPLEASGGGATAICGARAGSAPTVVLTAARGSSCATDYSAADTATTYGYANGSNHANSSTYGSALAPVASTRQSSCGVRDLAEVRTSLHGVARGRWSRDSAAAAAALWGNEAAEAVAAAARFTAEQVGGDRTATPLCGGAGDSDELASSFWTARTYAATSPSPSRHRPTAAAGGGGGGGRGFRGNAVATALGGLYGIRESGPVPSLPLSLEFSDSDDGGVAVIDVESSAGGAGGFVLSSGLGAEAQRRHCERRGSSGSSGIPLRPLSQAVDDASPSMPAAAAAGAGAGAGALSAASHSKTNSGAAVTRGLAMMT